MSIVKEARGGYTRRHRRKKKKESKDVVELCYAEEKRIFLDNSQEITNAYVTTTHSQHQDTVEEQRIPVRPEFCDGQEE